MPSHAVANPRQGGQIYTFVQELHHGLSQPLDGPRRLTVGARPKGTLPLNLQERGVLIQHMSDFNILHRTAVVPSRCTAAGPTGRCVMVPGGRKPWSASAQSANVSRR